MRFEERKAQKVTGDDRVKELLAEEWYILHSGTKVLGARIDPARPRDEDISSWWWTAPASSP